QVARERCATELEVRQEQQRLQVCGSVPDQRRRREEAERLGLDDLEADGRVVGATAIEAKIDLATEQELRDAALAGDEDQLGSRLDRGDQIAEVRCDDPRDELTVAAHANDRSTFEHSVQGQGGAAGPARDPATGRREPPPPLYLLDDGRDLR